jgi:ribose transport system ATP-binding protein
VVVASYSVVEGAVAGRLALGLAAVVGTAALVGLVNGVLVQYVRINPVVATLAMYMALHGLALTLRSTPGGLIDSRVTAAVERTVGLVPVAFLVLVAVACGLELALRRSRWGLQLRAVGSRRDAAARLGVRVGPVQVGAYLLCTLLVVLGGVMLMAQIGVGDANSGTDYTLSSITAVVLGGASIFGGRGSFLGALLGATLIQQINNTSTFLHLSSSWQYGLLALLTIGAAAAYSRARASGEATR